MADDDDENGDEGEGEDFTPNIQLQKSRKLAQKACKDLLCFMSFLTLFTVVQVVGQTAHTSLFAEHVRASFSPRLYDVVNEETWYTYMHETFLPKAFHFQGNRTDILPDTSMFADAADVDRWFLKPASDNAFHTPDDDLLVAIDQSNHMLGAVRVRQYRVAASENCISGNLFAHFTTSCYQGFSSRNAEITYPAEESDDGNGENGNGDGTLASNTNGGGSYGMPGESPPFKGVIATYSGNAFYVDFTSRQEASAELDAMKARSYINTGTRLISLDFTVYNSNLDQFALTRISFEFGPSGIVEPAIRLSVVRRSYLGPFDFDTTADAITSIGDIGIILFLMYYMLEEFSELTVSRWSYLDDGWNYMDWANMILLALAYAYRIKTYLGFAGVEIGAAQLQDRTTFEDFQTEAEDISTVRMLNSFNSVLLWIKCVKYVEFMPYIQFLYLTVNAIMDKYCSFLLLFIVLICGFIHAFTIGFGGLLSNMVSFDLTAVALLRSFLGDVDFLPVYREAPAFGAFLILTFYVLVMLVGINVFFAIIAAGISDNKSNIAGMQEDVRHLAMRDAGQQMYAWFSGTLERVVRECAPLYRRLYKKKVSPIAKTEETAVALPKGGKEIVEKKGRRHRSGSRGDASSRRSSLDSGSPLRDRAYQAYRTKITDFTTKELCNAADQMAGRLLVRIETASVEIKVEILRMKDSALEMVKATSILSKRIGQVMEEQDEFLADEGAG